MHNSSHVPRFKLFGWNGGLQNNACMLFNHLV
jgi:hypothetical protein